MKKYILASFIFCLFTGILVSCKGKLYRASSSSMEATLPMGKTFFVKNTSTFERNDIVVFEIFSNDYTGLPDEEGHYKQHWEKRVYRLIALSGDDVEIKDGDIFVNKKPVAPPPRSKMPYKVYATVQIESLESDNEFGGSRIPSGDSVIYAADLTKQEVAEYEGRKPAIIKVERDREIIQIPDSVFARPSADVKWSTDYYGPLHIPSPGDIVIVDDSNFKLYHNIPGIKKGKNIITEKLYFLLGDYRHKAEDSRYVGLIAQSNMIGVVK